jgi:DNA-binding NtrC family response regulator
VTGEFNNLKVLIVDDEADVLRGLQILVTSLGAQVQIAGSGREALKKIRLCEPHLLLSDITMKKISGLELLDAVKESYPDILVVLITGYGTIELAVAAIQRGASHFVTKPFDNDDILQAVRKFGSRALVKEKLRQSLLSNPFPHNLLTRSGAMKKVLETIQHVSSTRMTVLIHGESGTGKEVVANAIHKSSAGHRRPFLPLNTAALPDTLLESELFGHRKGAFTGAEQSRQGIFEQAKGGTVFLDEIGLMSPVFQGKLLRVLQERTVIPLGSSQPIAVDFRLISATNSDLLAKIEDGAFRRDLFYRLHVVRIDLPPLRERAEDIELLAEHFLEKYAPIVKSVHPEPPTISSRALDTLKNHRWPGNVRELENCIQRALVTCRSKEIRPCHLGLLGPKQDWNALEDQDLPYEENKQLVLRRFQRQFLEKALSHANGNVTRAAGSCGLTRAAFQRIMRSLNIDRSSFIRA